MDTYKIGKFIAQNRKKLNMTQAQLAEKLGVTGKTVSRWENGNYMPDLSLLQPLAKELDITLNELLQGEYIPQEQLVPKAEETIRMTVDYSNKKIHQKQKAVCIIVVLCMIVMLLTGYKFTQDNYLRDGLYNSADRCRNAWFEAWDISPGTDSIYWRNDNFQDRWLQVCMFITDDQSGIFLIEKVGNKYRVADRSSNVQKLNQEDDDYIQMHTLHGYYHKEKLPWVYIHWDAVPGDVEIKFRDQPVEKMATVNGYTLWYRITDYWPDFAEITVTEKEKRNDTGRIH
ncbi:MAG: helix-turn-helix transcriptional regulator [Oscillospiraceae bacterium]|nr:helix-turn-helix transcriptional regulator [Oscillospiraceae bacterium]